MHACVLSHFSCVQLFVTLWTGACQAPLSMEFPSKNTGVGCQSFPSPGDLPNPEIEPMSLVSPALRMYSLLLSYRGSPFFSIVSCIYVGNKNRYKNISD